MCWLGRERDEGGAGALLILTMAIPVRRSSDYRVGDLQSPAMEGRAMRRFWDARAREDALYFVDNRRPYRAAEAGKFWEEAEAVDYLLGGLGVNLSAADKVLEIGCGVGRMTRGLAARAGSVVALDVSPEMLARARAYNPELPNVDWVLGDGVSLRGLPDASVDACVSVLVFQHIPEPEVTLGYVREVGRVLRAGGWAALQVSNDPEVHRPRAGLGWRARALLGRAPRGQTHRAWLGSHVELDQLRAAAREGDLSVEKVWGAGEQYCQVLLRKQARRSGPPHHSRPL
jgi:SAM-dependent methyltransferase